MPRTAENDPEKIKKKQTIKHIKVISASIQKILTYTPNMEFRKECLEKIGVRNSQEAGKKLEKLLKQQISKT